MFSLICATVSRSSKSHMCFIMMAPKTMRGLMGGRLVSFSGTCLRYIDTKSSHGKCFESLTQRLSGFNILSKGLLNPSIVSCFSLTYSVRSARFFNTSSYLLALEWSKIWIAIYLSTNYSFSADPTYVCSMLLLLKPKIKVNATLTTRPLETANVPNEAGTKYWFRVNL